MSKRCLFFACCAMIGASLVISGNQTVFAEEDHETSRETQMTLAMTSQGFPFGTIQMNRKVLEENDGKRIVEETTATEMNYTTGDDEYSFESTEVAWIGDEGLVKYDASLTENGETTLLKAGWINDSLLVRARFSEGDEWVGFEFEKKDFDITLPEIPPLERVIQSGGKLTVNWLSFYEMSIAPVTIEHKGKERMNVGDQSFECDVIVFDNPSMGLGGKIWIARDEFGPFLLREEGRSPDGPFTMQVTEYQCE